MKVVTCTKCGAKNRVDENRLANSEAKCGRCGTTLAAQAENGASAGPTVVTDSSFQQEVLNASGPPTLVDFGRRGVVRAALLDQSWTNSPPNQTAAIASPR
jgi:hypothetical protein